MGGPACESATLATVTVDGPFDTEVAATAACVSPPPLPPPPVVGCCNRELPGRLIATIPAVTGCECFPISMEMNHDGNYWVYTGVPICDTNIGLVNLICTNDDWQFSNASIASTTSFEVVSCDPLMVTIQCVFALEPEPGSCPNNTPFTVYITEPA